MDNVKQLFRNYIDSCEARGLRRATIVGEEQTFKTVLDLMPEIKRASDLTEENFNLFFRRLRTRGRVAGNKGMKVYGIKESTAYTYWGRLNKFMNWLIYKDILSKNPVTALKMTLPKYTDDKTLSMDEIEKIICAIDLHSKDPFTLRRDKTIVMALFYLGVRRGELEGLQVSDVDFLKHQITIQGKTSKSRETRIIPIHPVLENHLREYIEERKKKGYKNQYLWVSTNKDNGLTKHGFKHWVNKFRKLSGVRFHLHQFRHTFATMLGKEDIGITKIMALMGHRTLKMTTSYLRSIKAGDLAEDIRKINMNKLV